MSSSSSSSQIKSASFALYETLFWTSITLVGFLGYNQLCEKVLRSSSFLATHASYWRFKNVFISFSHALLATALVVVSIFQTPELFADMINVSSKFSYIQISVSLGYFIYDTMDILRSNKKLSSQSKEVLIHHALIIFIFSIPLSVNKFVGYTIGALSIEFNTIFLHLRFMLVFCGIEKSSLFFRVISILNLATFIMFRILTLCWMTRWIVINRHLIHIVWFSIGSTGLAIMMVINIFLLQRLLQSDFSSKSSSSSTKPVESVNNNNNHHHTNGKGSRAD